MIERVCGVGVEGLGFGSNKALRFGRTATKIVVVVQRRALPPEFVRQVTALSKLMWLSGCRARSFCVCVAAMA